MNQKEAEEELAHLFNDAPPHRQKQIRESVEFNLARQSNDMLAAFGIAYGIVFGTGATKRERKKVAKKIKQENAFRDNVREFFE